MRKTIIVLLLFSMFLTFLPSPGLAADDLTGHVLEHEMREVVALGIMRGYSEGVYGPNYSITRAEFATFIARALNLPSPPSDHSIFTDVAVGVGLAEGVYRAAAAGIVRGYPNDVFLPNQKISREQMAAMIDRALEYKSIKRTPVFLSFTDVNQITPMFQPAISHNVYFGIITGNPAGNGQFRFGPKEDATRGHAAAFISRMLRVIKSQGETIATYQIAKLNNGQIQFEPRQYMNYSDAFKNLNDPTRQVIYFNQKIIKMNDGIVVASPSPGNATVIIYEENLRNDITYVVPGTSLKYLDADDKKVKVQIADSNSVGYVKQTEVSLVPNSLVQKDSYYDVIGGELRHLIYDHSKKTTASYILGPAPKPMSNGETYSSWNGIDFVGINNNKTVSYVQYFNYLPLHTKSNYTAEELNAYVSRERPNSPLKDLGHVFIEAQEQYGVNALYLLAKAIHESNWGLSIIAQQKNNLFGLNATDSDPEGNADTFESLEGCIMHAARFFKINYLSLGNFRYNGAFLGNKSKGLNVRYASDPYWGQKIAGHMNRADKFLGRKDYNQVPIGVTTGTGINIRTEPIVSPLTVQYTYTKPGFYVAIIEEVQQADGIWYKIHSDHAIFSEAWVRSDMIKKIVFE